MGAKQLRGYANTLFGKNKRIRVPGLMIDLRSNRFQRFIEYFSPPLQETFLKPDWNFIMSKKMTAAITAIGGYVPEDRLTNADLEKMVDTNDEWIRTRTGIEERRILKGAGKATSDLCVPVVLEICRKRGIQPDEIEGNPANECPVVANRCRD